MADDQQNPEPNLLRRILGGGFSALAGTVSPEQAYQMGMPQAAGLTPQQLQQLINAPLMQQQTQNAQLQNQLLQRRLSATDQPSSQPKTFQDPNSKAWFYTETDSRTGLPVTKPLSAAATGGNKLSNEDVQAGVQYLLDGGTTGGFRGRGVEINKIFTAYEQARKKNPGLMSRAELDKSYAGDMKRISSLNSNQTRGQLIAIDQFNAAIDRSMELVNKLGNSNFIPLNKVKQAIATNAYAGSQYANDVSELNALASEIALSGGNTFSSVGATDVRFKNELIRLNSAQTSAQFKQVAQRLKQIANVRKNAILDIPTLGTRKTPNEFQPSGSGETSQQPQNGSMQIGRFQVETVGDDQ